MNKLLVVLGGLIILITLSGCTNEQNEEPSVIDIPTTTQLSDSVPTDAPATEITENKGDNTVSCISQDIVLLHDIAVKHFVELRSIKHEGSKISVSIQADEHQNFEDYITALNETGRFTNDVVLPTGPPEVKSGLINLELSYQANILHILEKADQAPPTTDLEAVDTLVKTAEKNGIVVDPGKSKLLIPAPTLDTEKVGLITYKIISFENIIAQGKYEYVIAFISTIESGTTPEPIILKSVTIAEVIEDDGAIENRAVIGLDFYTRS